MSKFSLVIWLFATAGMWTWVVLTRGTLNIWLANLAGFVAAVIVGMVVQILFPTPDAPQQEQAPFVLYSIMAGLGTLVGTWFWLAARRRPQSLLLRHLLAGTVSCFTGLVALGLVWALLIGR